MGTPTTGAVTAVGVLFSILAIIALSSRIYSNRRYQKSVEIDDILILPAFLLTVTAGVALIVGGQLNIIGGHSLPMITPPQQARVGKFEYAFWMGHVVTMTLVKLSILFFFRRLFRGRAKRTAFDYANWILIVLVIGWGLSFLFFDAFACKLTPQASWSAEFWLKNACFNTFAIILSSAVTNWILDLSILIEPLAMIATLHQKTKKKLQFSAVFSLSILAVVAGLIRMINFIGVSQHGETSVTLLGVTLSLGDIQAIATQGVFWSYIEISVGFLVACMLPAAKVIDAISSSSTLLKLKSLPSSIWQRTRRSNSDSTGPDKEDAHSEDSWLSNGKPQKTGMHNYSREMASINGLPSTVGASSNHAHLGNYSSASGPGGRAEQSV